MSIEIKELHIRVSLSAETAAVGSTSVGDETKDQAAAESVEQVLQTLQHNVAG